jgi:hypothetical protein
MQRRSLVRAEIAVEQDHLDLGTVGKISRLVENNPAVLHPHLERLHDVQCSVRLLPRFSCSEQTKNAAVRLR